MKIIFFGTSSFATASLMLLINSKHEISAVVTQPDRRSGRGLIRTFSPVKLVAQKYELTVLQPSSVASGDFIKTIEQLKASIFVVAAFGQILSKDLLEIPKLYSINVHSSLLPKYRGAAPINWAVLKGETSTGVTIFRMTEGTDEGEIISAKEINIEDEDNALTLNDKLSKIGAELLIKTLDSIDKKKAKFTKQDNSKATYAPKLQKKNGLIDWTRTGRDIHNHVRAMVPWPAAFTTMNSKHIKIMKTRLLNESAEYNDPPGTVLKADRGGIVVKTGDGALLILELQAEASKKMTADAYCRGNKLEAGQRFS